MPMPVSFAETEIPDVKEVHVGLHGDPRGFFSETYSRKMWQQQGFDETFVQDNLSLSCKGTLRGLHYQIEPHGMGKLVRALRGAIFDVAVDLRKGSPTFGKWVARTLSAENNLALWVPAGFAHGLLALEDDTLVYYKCTEMHTPKCERALSYRDPAIGIEWPFEPTEITEKDANAPLLADAEYNFAYEP